MVRISDQKPKPNNPTWDTKIDRCKKNYFPKKPKRPRFLSVQKPNKIVQTLDIFKCLKSELLFVPILALSEIRMFRFWYATEPDFSEIRAPRNLSFGHDLLA